MVILLLGVVPLRPCPENALSPSEAKNIIGKKLRTNLNFQQHLKISDISDCECSNGLSIIITSYNCERFLRDCIDSV